MLNTRPLKRLKSNMDNIMDNSMDNIILNNEEDELLLIISDTIRIELLDNNNEEYIITCFIEYY